MLKRELSVFLVVGLLTVAIDFGTYRGLIYLDLPLLNNVNLAKGIGFVSGTIFAYFANRFWTFSQQITAAGSIGRFILVYALGLAANIAVNHLSISWLNSTPLATNYILSIAFLLATGISATFNFIGMKFFVFTKR
jgi:putative flippase GtrA